MNRGRPFAAGLVAGVAATIAAAIGTLAVLEVRWHINRERLAADHVRTTVVG